MRLAALRRRQPASSLTGMLSNALAGILVVGVLVLGISVVSGVILVASQLTANRYREATAAVRDAHATLLDEETGVRGYLLSHDARFLDSYRAAQPRLDDANRRLEQALGSDGDLAPMVLSVRLAQQRWIDEWATPGALVGSGAATPSDSFLGAGKTLFDAYRQQETTLSSTLDARSSSVADEQTALFIAARLGVGGLVLALIVGVVRQRRRLRRAVGQPVDALLDYMRRVEAGEIGAEAPTDGPVEVARIGGGLHRMTEALATQRSLAVRLGTESEAQTQRFRHVLALSREISGSLSMRYVLRSVGTSTLAVSGFSVVRVALVEDGADRVVVAYDSTRPGGLVDDGEAVDLGAGVTGRAAKYGQTVRAAEVEDDPLAGRERPDARIAVPMIVGARVAGVITLHGAVVDDAGLDAEVVAVLETLASHAATAVEAARLHSEATERSIVDPLTTLLNRRQLDHDLAEECARSARYSRPLGFVMLDVDHFKAFNDTYGHQRGDECLQVVGRILATCLRGSDTAYRYGGEEFALLLRETDLDGAARLAERVRVAIEERFSQFDGRRAVTASFGVAALGGEAREPQGLVAAADAALYAAKRAGRNRVVVDESSAPASGISMAPVGA